nr:integrin alpha-PS4-like [Onthophagus taurus]
MDVKKIVIKLHFDNNRTRVDQVNQFVVEQHRMWYNIIMKSLLKIIFITFCTIIADGSIFDPQNTIVFNSSGYFGYSVYLEYLDVKRFQLLSAAPKDNVVRSCTIEDGCQRFNVPLKPSKINFVGASISGTGVANRNTVICNPQYADEKYHTNGICYFKQKTFKEYSPLSKPSRQIGRYNKTLEYLYSHGQLGFSIKYIPNVGFLLGAPGVLSWKGTILKYSFDGDDAELNPESKVEKLSYLGYSLEYGSFNFRGRMISCIVAGAPKGSKVHGQVQIYSYSHFPYTLLKIFNGDQFGSYFGHTLLVANSDLFISAPMYSVKSYEEGCVYIFYGLTPNLPLSQTVCGIKAGGRFGFAMSFLGKFGNNLLNVVAISAPYEDEMSGSIHLFNKNEDSYMLLQKIRGKSVYENIRGFGFSLSNALDVDQNSYTDFAVGAYLSDKVIIFKSKPILMFTGVLNSDVNHIQDDINTLNITYCYEYKGYDNTMITTEYNIISDDRIEFENKNIYIEDINVNSRKCNNIHLKLRPHAHYNPYPLNIKIINKIKDCPSCPIVYPNDTINEIEIPSTTGCGKDLICTPNLTMTNSFQNLTNFIVGSTHFLPLIIEIANNGETAYHCKLNLSLNAEINRIPASCFRHENVIICDISNRFINGQKKVLNFEVDLKNYYNYTNSIKGEIRVLSVGEGDGKTVNATINLPLVYKANLTLIGHSSPEYLLYNPEKESYNIHHQYVVFNNGPSPLINQYVTIFIPQNVSNINGEFKNIFNISSLEENLCSSEDIPLLKRKRSIEEIPTNFNATQDGNKKVFLDCNASNNKMVQCKRFICNLELLVNHSLKLDFSITVELNKLVKSYDQTLKNKDFVVFESFILYNLTSPKISTFLYTNIAKQTVAIWIWVVSVILAILILALIVYGLYRLKFFKRRDVQTLVNEEEISSGE